MSEDIVIPDKPAFKAAEVCELLRVPAYVLRSWENEFRDLGVSKTVSGPRVYRREDVARALRIRDLVLNEGLTLAGVRRRLERESGAPSAEDTLIAEITASTSAGVQPAAPEAASRLPAEWRTRVSGVREGLREIHDMLSRPVFAAGVAPAAPVPAPARRGRASGPPRAAATAPSPEPGPAALPIRELVVEPDEPSLFADGDLGSEPPIGGAGSATERRRGLRSS